jgi:hypothetical protein
MKLRSRSHIFRLVGRLAAEDHIATDPCRREPLLGDLLMQQMLALKLLHLQECIWRITPTPVINAASRTMYVLARTKEHGTFVQKLHALDVTNGKEKPGSSVVISATVRGSGDGAVGGKISFEPLKENLRAALLLAGGEVYLTWASSCDIGPYHGWVTAYDAHTLQQRAVLNTSPDGGDAGIWQSDAGPVADDEGNIYVATGNGTFNGAKAGGRDLGDSVLKLRLEGQKLVVRDYFTPFNQKVLDAKDWDLVSQGPVLLPAQAGTHPHLLVVAGKEGKLYLLDRDKLGKFQEGSDSQIVQSVKGVEGCVWSCGLLERTHHLYGSKRYDARLRMDCSWRRE